ncbi:meiotic spindle pole body protein Kms1 [Dionaea muscipula]
MASQSGPSTSAAQADATISDIDGVREVNRQELESLTLVTHPLRTLKFFVLAVTQYVQRPASAAKTGSLMIFSALVMGIGIIAVTIRGPQEELFQELIRYSRFVVWWLALGVASSIGLGSGLHTFVLYLGPHIALFTMKAVDCGRVDLKSAPYDTVQWSTGPSWLGKDCSEYGPPPLLSDSESGSWLPFNHILQQVQLEAVLWGIGTALGELPPYFISRAASASGKKVEVMEERNSASSEDSVITKLLKQIKLQFLSHTQYLNFFTVLVLASIPNPLFDLAGIMCGQFGIPFWKFFSATMIGKAIIKTHIQTIFIILTCNNQLLDLVENQLFWILGFIPGLSSMLPGFMSRVRVLKETYMTAASPPNVKVNRWNVTLGSIWNTVVWLMLINFVIKIINTTAQSSLKDQQEKEIVSMTNSHEPNPTTGGVE